MKQTVERKIVGQLARIRAAVEAEIDRRPATRSAKLAAKSRAARKAQAFVRRQRQQQEPTS